MLTQEINTDDKSTKDVILEYLKLNRGREIAVSEISGKFDYKLNRISNAIRELEFKGEIIIDRRPLKKGKYTVIRLRGDTITKFASHEREISPKNGTSDTSDENITIENFSVAETIKILNSPDYTQLKFKELIEPYYDNYLTLITEIIEPTLYEVGKMWEREDITVAEEHLMSARIEKFLIDLIANETRRKNKTIILAPVENEYHTLVLLAVELLLIERGYNVINLSRSIQVNSIVDFIKKMKVKPDWLFFSITMDSYVNNLKQDLRLIKEEFKSGNLKIAVGGQGIKNLDTNDFVEVDFLVKTVDDLQSLLYSL